MSKWFICENEHVTGPFSTEEVKVHMQGGKISSDSLIWGKPQVQWQSLDWWANELPNMMNSQSAPSSEQLWHYALDGSSHGPLKRPDLVEELKDIKRIDDVLVWTKGMKSWVGIFEFHDLLDEVGLNRRQFPRAPISGQAVLNVDGQTHISTLKTISSGGVGVDYVEGQFSIGQLIQVEIRSEAFSEPITANATVQYVTDGGFVGFKFQQIASEGKAKIIEYVRSFEASQMAA